MDLGAVAFNSLKWSILIQFGYQVISFIVSIILARTLLPQDFGTLGMIAIFISVGRVLLDGGMMASLLRTPVVKKDEYSSVFTVNLILSLILYLAVFFSASLISGFYNFEISLEVIRVACLVFIINALSLIQSTKLNKELKFRTQFLVQIPALVISSIISISMAKSGYGIWSLVVRELSFAGIATILLWKFSDFIPSLKIKFSLIKQHLNFGSKIILTGLIDSIVGNIYKVFIGKNFSATQLGYFTNAKTIQELPGTTILSVFNRFSIPLLSTISEDKVKLMDTYRKIIVQILFVSIPILTLALILAEPLFRYGLTDKWVPAVPYFQVMCIAGLFMPIYKVHDIILRVVGRSDIILSIAIYYNILILIGLVVLLYTNVLSLLWYLVLVNIIITLISGYYQSKLIDYSASLQLIDLAAPFLCSIIVGTLIFILDLFIFGSNFSDGFRILVLGVGGLIGYVLLSYPFHKGLYRSVYIHLKINGQKSSKDNNGD